MNEHSKDERARIMPVEKTQQLPKSQAQKRAPVLSPELREVLHMLQSLEAKPASTAG